MAYLGSFMRYKPSKSEWAKIAKVKCNNTTGIPIYGFLSLFTSSIWPILAHLWHINLQNLNDLDFDLSRSLNVKCDSVIGLPIYDFLLMFNSDLGPNSAPLLDIRLQNLSDLESDLSRSLKVKCDNVIGLATHGFLLIHIVITCLTLTL